MYMQVAEQIIHPLLSVLYIYDTSIIMYGDRMYIDISFNPEKQFHNCLLFLVLVVVTRYKSMYHPLIYCIFVAFGGAESRVPVYLLSDKVTLFGLDFHHLHYSK